MHRLLQRQLRKHLGHTDGFAEGLQGFIDAVESAYTSQDEDRQTLERSMDLSSRELVDRNAELFLAERKLRSIFENVVDGLFQLTPAGRLLAANPAMARILGYDTPADLLGGQDQAPLDEIFSADVLSQALDAEQEVELVRGDEVRLWVAVTARAVRDDSGRLLLYEGTVRDVTRRRRMESEREELNSQLVEASRRAGMAEVATDVLHNVGNVFNSVNVSATMALRRLDSSRLPGLLKGVRMLRDVPPDARGRFVTDDPKGQLLPDYFCRLADQLALEQEELRQEMTTLGQHLEHVKRVIAMQQGYARSSGVIEEFQLGTVIEDAIRLQGASFERHGIAVVRQLRPIGTLRLDKHQILQILVNLLTNARHAMSDPSVCRKELTLRAGYVHGDRTHAFVEVADTGVGIPAANLTRIFSHGFTTRQDGHGFGLHGAALSAASMGGSLVAQSDGPGCGACFRLSVPTVADGPRPVQGAA